MGEREKILSFLETELTRPVRDPVWKHILLSPGHEKIISSRVFQSLHEIKQLGPAYLVYPGATHTRFAHSLGTFHIAGRIIRGLARRGDPFSLSLDGVKAFLAAALLHDLGHYPFAHALKNLGLTEHEVLTGRLVREEPLSSLLLDGLGVAPETVQQIVDRHCPVPEGSEIRALRRLLSGVLDPDKLDYLNRDAYYCGVPYGVQDVDFFLEEIVSDREAGFALSAKGITAVENLLFSKYLMYKTVYWHKTVRIATAMIKKALLLALRDRVLAPESLYFLTDGSFREALARHRYPSLSLIEEVFQRRLYKQIVRVPFEPEHPRHRRLCVPETCLQREAELAREFGQRIGRTVAEHEVVIDIPEEITFEIDLPIVSPAGVTAFKKTKSIFHPASAGSIGESLRSISLFVKRDDDLVRAAESFSETEEPFSP